RVQRPPGLPCALCSQRVMACTTRAQNARRECVVISPHSSLRGATATKQSRVACVALDCFACARNDGARCLKIESETHSSSPSPGGGGSHAAGSARCGRGGVTVYPRVRCFCIGDSTRIDLGFTIDRESVRVAHPTPPRIALRSCESTLPLQGRVTRTRQHLRAASQTSRRLAEPDVEMLQPRQHLLLQQAQRVVPGLALVLVVEAEHQEHAEAAD